MQLPHQQALLANLVLLVLQLIHLLLTMILIGFNL